jgi:AhpD family alkylhydroperoxidase
MTARPEPRTPVRLERGSRRDVGWPVWAFARLAGRVTHGAPPSVFLAFGRRPSLLWTWLPFASRLMPRGRLPRRETELVILRVATVRGCAYEFDHHERLARRTGVGETDVARVLSGPEADGWSPRERVLLAATDQLLASHDLDDATWERLRGELDEGLCVELLLLVGHYDMLATMLNTLRVPLDHEPSGRSSG